MSLTNFLIASGIAFWTLFAITVGLSTAAVYLARHADPARAEAAKGIAAIEQHLSDGDS